MKALVQRLEDEPFAIVGINTDRDKDVYRKKVAEHGVTWRSAWQGSPSGPIPASWGVDSYPTVFVLDASHVIRHVGARGARLGAVVDELLDELRREQAPPGETGHGG